MPASRVARCGKGLRHAALLGLALGSLAPDVQTRVREQVIDGVLKAHFVLDIRTPATPRHGGLDNLHLAVAIVQALPPRPRATT